MYFEKSILTSLFKNAKLNIKKKTKKKAATHVFQNFGSVGKWQTNIFSLGLTVSLYSKIHMSIHPTMIC